MKKEKSRKQETQQVRNYYDKLERFIEGSSGPHVARFCNFAKFAPRQVLTEFLVKYELFKKILDVPGSIVECGVFNGQGLMGFAQFSAILEPVHFVRKVIGFDTFQGFSGVAPIDKRTSDHIQMKRGGMSGDSKAYTELQQAIHIYDMNRFLNHLPKVELVKGDVMKSIPKYLKDNPHLIISLLYLDMDLYAPTKFAIQKLLPRIPKGGIIVFDEINHAQWPGETQALMETCGIPNLRLKRFPFDSRIAYAEIM